MKIHFIISTLRGGGAERVALLLANSFSRRAEYELTIITLNKGQEYEVSENIERIKLDQGRIPNHTVRSFINLFKYYMKKKHRPDIIVSFITLTNLITIPIAKFYGIKIIAAEHNNHLRNMEPLFLSKFTKKHLYRRADLLTVLTSYDVGYYKEFGANVKVIPNPCTFEPLAENTNTRENVILAVGKLDRYHHKGFDNLIPLVAPVLKANPQWKLKIVGNGDVGHELLLGLVKKYNLQRQVVFTGFLSNVSELMRDSAIFILSSRFEGLPMVLLEAMSQGMACVAYDCVSGPSDVIDNNVNGILVEDQNVEKMRKSLEKLIKDPDLRYRLGNNGIQSLGKYNIETLIDGYGVIFNKLLQS